MDEIWTTKDGQKIAVGDMDEGHVRNALRLMLRNKRKDREVLQDQLWDDPFVGYDGWGDEKPVGFPLWTDVDT